MSSSDQRRNPEIERRFAAAGLVVPEDRAAGAFAAAQRLLEATHWLRRPRAAAAEPAHVFFAGVKRP